MIRSSGVSSTLRAGAAVAALAAMLAGCAKDTTGEFAPYCAPAEVLGDAAELYNYSEGGQDVRHLVTRASLMGLKGHCSGGKGNEALHTRLRVTMQVVRGPAAQHKDVTIPYFVALLHDGAVVEKKNFSETVHFPDNVSTVTVTTAPAAIDLPAEANEKGGRRFQLKVGFQLTREQLEYNRTHLAAPTFQEF